MLRAKGPDRSLLVSDATALAGCAPGRYRTPVGGEVELSKGGRLGRVGSDYLAGAARSLMYGVAFVANDPAFGLASALDLATVQPGRFVCDRGILAAGRAADLILFGWQPGDSRLAIRMAIVQGRPPVN